MHAADVDRALAQGSRLEQLMNRLDGIVCHTVRQLYRQLPVLGRQGNAVGHRGAQLGIARGEIISADIGNVRRQRIARIQTLRWVGERDEVGTRQVGITETAVWQHIEVECRAQLVVRGPNNRPAVSGRKDKIAINLISDMDIR